MANIPVKRWKNLAVIIMLARRPCELAAAEEVYVEMWDGFSAMRAVIDGDAEALPRKAEIRCDFPGSEQQVAEDGLII